MKSHYDLLGLDPAADVEAIKKAFRREIAKYHPDKVTHLGAEFQEMAAMRAAELTAAYKTLSDPEARSEYDAELGGDHGHGAPARHAAPAPSEASSPATPYAQPQAETDRDETSPGAGRAGGERFAQERAGRDDIVRRAIVARVKDVLRQYVGVCDMKPLRGFEIACLSRTKPSLFRRTVPPSVLVRLAPLIDGPLAAAAWSSAVNLRLGVSPLILLLIGEELAPDAELAKAIEQQRRRNPSLQDSLFPVPIDSRDWSARVPANAPPSVRALTEHLRNYAG